MVTNDLNLETTLGKFKYAALWSIILSSLIGCQKPLIRIQEISSKKTGKTVSLTGKVVHVAPFVGNAAYQMEDHTGRVWVVTEQNLPQVGQQLNIKGKIEYQSLPFVEQELGDFYLIELEQLELSDKN